MGEEHYNFFVGFVKINRTKKKEDIMGVFSYMERVKEVCIVLNHRCIYVKIGLKIFSREKRSITNKLP